MSRFKRIKNKTSKKSSVSIDEKIIALNKELEKTGMLSEVMMTTSNVYSTSTNVPADPGGTFPVPDTSGVTGDGFNQPVSGNPDDPSNWPDAYANDDWLFNPNDVNGESDRPIVKSLDSGLINAFNAAFPDNGKYPSGGGGVVFGNLAFGTAVGYARNGHFQQVLNPGLHGNGSVNVAPRFEYPYFGITGYYFPIAGDEEAHLIIGMSKLWMSLGYTTDASKVHQLQLWTPHNNFHDGPYADWSGKKYTDSEGRRYVLKPFYIHRAGNTYFVNPTPESQTNVQIRGTEDPPIYPGPIANLFGLGARAFEWLFGKAKGGRPTSPKDPEDPKTTETKTGMEGEEDEEEKEKQKLLANAKRIDANNQRLADQMTSSDPRNLSAAAVTLTIGGTYIVVKSLYTLMVAAIAAGYSLYQLQQLQSDFEADWESNIVWKSTLSDAEWERQAQEGRERDAQEAKEANARVENAEEELKNAEESGNEERIARAKEAYENALKNRQRVINNNTQNNIARRKARRARYGNKDNPTGTFYNSYKPQGDVLSEGVGLGHFEPEQLNVDIEDLRKGIMPEYPKQPPAEMIDGYHQKSPLRPKPLEDEPLVKITKADLIRNHRLKSVEADEMMDTINRLNDHIKKHPEDLIHAQQRYPAHDPRLAELNWKMDQMLEAGEEYLDNNFKENQTLYKRATDRTKKNIKLTDPEYVQQHYDELRGTTQGKVINPKPRDIKLKSKLKKHLPQYESKSFFKHVNSKDFKKISKKTEEKKLLEKESLEYIESVMQQVKYSWREYDVAAELREGMTTADVTVTQVPAQGEGESNLATLDTSVADSFSDNTDRDAPPSGLKNTDLVDGGTGSGSMGGFDIGPHLRFRGSSQPRWATLNAVDTSASDTIIVNAIRGSDFNGGEIPDLDNEALQLWYYDSPNRSWRPLNQNPLGVTDNTVNHILIPNVPGEGSIPPEDKILRDWTLTLPSWARGPEIKFMFYQSHHSGASYDHYGIKSVSYRRNTPLTVFAPLDTPEASAFIRMNPITYRNRYQNRQDRFAPKKEKKNLEKMLEASDKYVATYLGPDFPGMNTEITPITMQTFEQQTAAMDARDDLVNKIKSVSDFQTEKYNSLTSRRVSDYHTQHYRDSINELNNFGQSYQNAIDTQNYDEANRLVQNTSKNVIRALGGQVPVFDKSGEVSLAPVTDKYGRTYNPNYELTQEQVDEIDKRYGVTTDAAMRTANESPYSYTLDLGMDNVGQMFDELLNRYDVDEEKLEKGYTYSSPYGDRIYSDRRATVGGEISNKSTGHWTPWYGGSGFKMFRGADKPTTWDGVGWYPSRVGTNHWQGHRYDGMAYGAFFRIYVGDGLNAREIRAGKTTSTHKNSNGRSDAANLAYYLNFSGSSSYFAERWTETVERKAYVNGKWQSIEPIEIERSKLGTQRDGMTYFHSWYQSIDRLRAEYGKPPLTNDPLLDALRKEQEENPNFVEPIEQSIDGQIKDENTDPDSLADELTELDDFLPIEDMDGFTADELEDMGIMWKGMLNDKPKRDDYDNTRSGAKKFSDDLKAYKQNQEIIAKNTKIIDYHKNTLASIASRDEDGKFDPEKYKAMFKEGENSFYINTMDYDFGKINNLLGSASESNPFGTNIAAFDKENTLAYDYSNGINLGLSSQNMADLFGGGRKIVTAANGKSYARFGDLDYEYKEDANNALNAFMESERDRLYYGGVDFENLSFGDNIFSTQQAFQDHLNLERAKSMNAINLMSLSLNNRLVEVENGFNPVLGSKQDFGAMSDAGVKVSGQSFPPDTNFDLVPVDSEGFFTREFNANLDKPKGSNLTYTQIAQLNDQLSVVGDNGMRRLYQAQARGASEEELGAIAASIWQAEKPISDQLALDYDSMFSPDGKISPTLNSILNNPLSNAIKSLADVATFDTFDFDNKGRSTNPIVNKINSSVRQLPGDAAMFIRYLTNTGPKIIDNEVLGQKRVETMIRNAETKGAGENAVNFNDNIAGTTQEPDYKNGKIDIGFTFDFEKNATEFQTAKENNAYVESWAGKIMKSITGNDNLGNKILEPLTKAMYSAMGEYSVDAQPSFPVIGTLLGPIFGQAIETAKALGGANAIPGNISITPKELYRINPKLYREYVSKGVIPDTERDYYGGFNTGSRIIPYNEAPYFSKNKKKGEDEGTFDVDMNYFPPGFEDAIRTDEIGGTTGTFDANMNYVPPGFEDAIRTDEIGDTQGQFMPSNPPGMRQQAVGTQVASPQRQGEPIFPSAAASTLTTTQSNALLDKGAKVERVVDFLNLGVTNKELNDLTKDIKVASHTSDKPLPKKLPSFGLKFKANLLGRYLTGNNKQFTEKDLDNAQLQSMYNQTEQILKAKDTKAFGMDNGVSVLDLTSQMSDERKAEYGMKPGEKIYQVSSYQGDQVLQPLENNDLIYVLGRYVVITQPGTDVGAPIEKIKEIRDDFDFEYGFNAVRADGGVPGSDDIIGKVKGDETPGVPGTLTKGKGIFGGGIPSELGIRGSEPVSSLAGRSIVNIGQGLGVGTPFPIRIQFNDENYNNAWKYEDDYPVYESKEPKRGKTLYEKVKKKVFFNPKDIKPEFPKDPPPKLDPETGMHPEYGKQVARYRKLDPHSADAMPETGDPEIDAEVMKQKSGKKKKKLSDFKRNIK